MSRIARHWRASIRATLRALGFQFDEPVLWADRSASDVYRAAFELRAHRAYPCVYARKLPSSRRNSAVA